jgi:alcohol dehydrogenase YqhD (iron-dependent ADH family)
VNKKQLKMIVTVFLGIKLFSNYMFLEPEKVNVLNLPQGQNEKRIDKVVEKYREFFYWFTI